MPPVPKFGTKWREAREKEGRQCARDVNARTDRKKGIQTKTSNMAKAKAKAVICISMAILKIDIFTKLRWRTKACTESYHGQVNDNIVLRARFRTKSG